ncbi:MAG TPA: hypothetical protein VGC87_10595 [Pyrinomonadaceae bacterium]|jgi:hypothetical protein
MKKAAVTLVLAALIGLGLLASFVFAPTASLASAGAAVVATESPLPEPPVAHSGGFEVEVWVDGRPLEEYAARGRTYVEALDGAEYELRIRNPLGVRVAVALSVDGMNTIDARRTSAWDGSKWVIEPYQTITIRGWQMSSSRARRFYFTTERDSYGAKLGRTANLGVITAVFFRERERVVVVPPPRPRDRYPVPYEEDGSGRSETRRRGEAPAAGQGRDGAKTAEAYPRPDDESAATGIGRNVEHDVNWINLDLVPRAAGEVMIRYEYHDALVRLGIFPRRYPREDVLRRRERSTGFEDRGGFSPEP